MTELILFQIVLETQMNAIELHTNIVCYQKVSMSFLCDLFIFFVILSPSIHLCYYIIK